MGVETLRTSGDAIPVIIQTRLLDTPSQSLTSGYEAISLAQLNQNRVGASSFRCLTSSDSAGSSFPWHNGTVAMDFRISHAHNGTPSFKKQKRFAGLRLWKNMGSSLLDNLMQMQILLRVLDLRGTLLGV